MEWGPRFKAAHGAALLTAALLACGPALAQQSSASKPGTASQGLPPPADLEPAVDTTKSAPGTSAAPAPTAPAATAPAPTASAPAASPAPGATAAKPNKAAASAEAAKAATSPAPGTTKGAKGGVRADRLELDTTDITGNRELPKVLYIVPWKRSDLGDLVGKPVNSLLDEVLQPLDRDVFQRQNRYYDALKPGQAAAKAGTAQSSEVKP